MHKAGRFRGHPPAPPRLSVSWALHAATPALCHSPAVLQPQGHDGGQSCCLACRRGRQSPSQGERVGLSAAPSAAARPPALEGAAARPGEFSCLVPAAAAAEAAALDRVSCHLPLALGLPAPAETVCLTPVLSSPPCVTYRWWPTQQAATGCAKPRLRPPTTFLPNRMTGHCCAARKASAAGCQCILGSAGGSGMSSRLAVNCQVQAKRQPHAAGMPLPMV